MYDYSEQRPFVFSEKGQVCFLAIRDHIQKVLKVSGCIDLGHAMTQTSGDTWDQMACVDRLVELGELREVVQEGFPAGQHRIFRDAKRP